MFNGNLLPIGYIDDANPSEAPANATFVVMSANATLTNERILTGTANQVIITDNGANSTVVLSLPQSVATTSTPQFAKVGIGAPADAVRLLLVQGDVAGGVVTFDRQNSATSSLVGVANFKATSTGDMADGFGGSIQFLIQDTAAVENIIASLHAVRDGADNSGSFTIQTRAAGVSATVGMWDSTGKFTLTPKVQTTGSPTGFLYTAPAHTTLTASVEAIDVNWNFARTVQWATGALTTQRTMYIQGQTLAFIGASTVTTAITLDIDAPVAGTNATITNIFAARFNGRLAVNASTANQIVLQGGSSNTASIVATAANTLLQITGNRSAAATGADVALNSAATRTAGDLLAVTNNGVVRAEVVYHGGITLTQSAGATGTLASFLSTRANHTNQTASTEISDFSLTAYTRQWATGAITTQRDTLFGIPTYAFVGASTITTAATVAIAGAPAVGTNATITNAYAFWVQAGTSRIDALLDLSGISAGSANIKITATSDTPTTTFSVVNATNAAPSGFLELNVGGAARYIPFYA